MKSSTILFSLLNSHISAITLAFCILFLLSACQTENRSPAEQPYDYIRATQSDDNIKWSPDPLVNYKWENPSAEDDLEIYLLKPEKIVISNRDEIIIESNSKKKTRIRVSGNGDIRFDFGCVNAAWLEFDSKDLTGKIEMSISEYTEPAILNSGAENRIKTLTPVKYGDTYRLELNDQLYEGVRYGWIHIRQFEEPFTIDDVRLVCQIRPTNYKGSFSCNDTMLNRIWYTGAYGVKLNLLEDFFGAILMERSDRFSWTGDAHPSQAASLVAFGNYDFIRLNLEHTSEQSNGIQSYSLYWVQSLYDYFTYTGDTATLRKYIRNASDKLDVAYEQYGTDPRQGFYGWDERLGAGFESPNINETQNAYKMLTISSWLKFSGMMDFIGEQELSNKYKGYAFEKIGSLRQNDNWYTDYGIHAAAEALNAGFPNDIEQNEIFTREFSNRLNNLSYSPFNQYFLINGMAKMNKYDVALTSIRDCWGGQIKYGGTTFFEVYRPSWNAVLGYNEAPPNNQCGYTSMCHPWGGGVVKWLSEEILGIKPLKPGFLECEISPNPGRSLTHIKGETPTPHGIIRTEMDISTGKLTISIPEGVQTVVKIPKVEKEIVSVSLQGNLIWKEGEIVYEDFKGRISEEENNLCISGITGGEFRFEIEYQGTTPEYRPEEWIYTAEFQGKDSLTGTDFKEVYGKDGFVLCGYFQEDDTAVDFRKLPAYIQDITYSKNFTRNWISDSDDKRGFSIDPEKPDLRSIGALMTQDPRPVYQTMTVDIHSKPDKEYQVALFFSDFENKGRRVAVELFNLESKEILTPVQIVRDFSGGKYLIYQYDNPVRFRINHVRGPNATLSGIFFDEVD